MCFATCIFIMYICMSSVWCDVVLLRLNVYHVTILFLPGGGWNTGAVNVGTGIHKLS